MTNRIIRYLVIALAYVSLCVLLWAVGYFLTWHSIYGYWPAWNEVKGTLTEAWEQTREDWR